MRCHTRSEAATARRKPGLTQKEAAAMIFSSCQNGQNGESGMRRTHLAF
ncbi:hypothetical protein [Sorlinia euscelidii]